MTRAETQTRIVDAAFRTLVEEGYHETTMKDIAGRAGLATGLATTTSRARTTSSSPRSSMAAR